MEQIILALHVLICLILIALILIQQGKGADAGASFGSAVSQTIFGSQGSATFITKMTAWFVAFFFVTSLSLGYFMVRQTSVTDLDELLKKVPVKSSKVQDAIEPEVDDIPNPLKSSDSTGSTE